MPLIKITPDGGGLGKAMAAGMAAGAQVLKAKRKKKAQPVPVSSVACPDCKKDQIEHAHGYVCACSVREKIATA